MDRLRKIVVALLLPDVARLVKGAVRRDEGQTLAEYALVMVVIALVVATAVALLGNKLTSFFASVASSI